MTDKAFEKEKNGFLCHIYGIPDGGEAREEFRGEFVKDYGEKLSLKDGRTLHWNYNWDDGDRMLMRCKDCGALLIRQFSEYHSFSDSPDGYYSDWIPVASEEEADLLNILWDAMELESYPYRHIRGNNFSFFWTKGEEPVPYDPENLRKQIREKYRELDLDNAEFPA